MQTMRYINLFRRISKVNTKNCFVYNNVIIYVVPSGAIRRALGDRGKNVKEIQETLGKKIRIIEEANNPGEAQRFVQDIVEPINFKSLEVRDGIFVLTAGSQGKAALFGRNKRRFAELNQILEDYFGKELKII